MSKQEFSKLKCEISLGFLYWLQENSKLRGLKDIDILQYPNKLNELLLEYNTKYPNGLTGWKKELL